MASAQCSRAIDFGSVGSSAGCARGGASLSARCAASSGSAPGSRRVGESGRAWERLRRHALVAVTLTGFSCECLAHQIACDWPRAGVRYLCDPCPADLTGLVNGFAPFLTLVAETHFCHDGRPIDRHDGRPASYRGIDCDYVGLVWAVICSDLGSPWYLGPSGSRLIGSGDGNPVLLQPEIWKATDFDDGPVSPHATLID